MGVGVGGDEPHDVVLDAAIGAGQQHHPGEVAATVQYLTDDPEGRGLVEREGRRPGEGGRVQLQVGAEQHQHLLEGQAQFLLKPGVGWVAGEHGCGGGGRDEVGHGGRDVHQQGGHDRLVEQPVDTQAMDRPVRRWSLEEGGRDHVADDRVAGDRADRCGVAGDEVLGVWLAWPPPAAGVLQDGVADQRLDRGCDRLGGEARQPAGMFQFEEGVVEVLVVDGDSKRCPEAELDHGHLPLCRPPTKGGVGDGKPHRAHRTLAGRRLHGER